MYFTHKFTDATAKSAGVRENTIDMIFEYFWYEAIASKSSLAKLTGMKAEDITATRGIIADWVTENQYATFPQISDFTSRLVEDYKEMIQERKAERGTLGH